VEVQKILSEIQKKYKQFLIEREYSVITAKLYDYWFRKFPIIEFLSAEGSKPMEIMEGFLDNKDNSVIRGFLRSFLDCFEIEFELPPKKIIKGRKAKKLKDPVPVEDIAKIEQRIYDWNFMKGIAFSVVYEGGLRRGELNKILFTSFNWKKWEKDYESQIELKIEGKGKKERIVLINNLTGARLIKKLMEKGYTEKQVLDQLKQSNVKMFHFGDKVFYNYLKKRSFEAIGKGVNPHLLRHCVSEDVEILTKEGWKTYKQLKPHEEIYTLNLENNLIELKPIKNIYKYKLKGKLNSIKNKYVNCLFTDEHKFVVKKRGEINKKSFWKEWELLSWEKIPTQFKIRLSGIKEKGKSIGLEKAGILGWILSDGSIHQRHNKDNDCSISISQSLSANKEKCDYIEQLLKMSDTPYSKIIEKPKVNNFNGKIYQMVVFHILKGGNHSRKKKGKNHEWIFEFINKNRTPKWKLLELPNEELKEIYKCMMLGDGSRGIEYCNQNKKRIDFFRVLSHFIGKRTLLSKGILNQEKGKEKYRTFICNREDCQIDKKHIGKENYKGIVWCPEVDNETFIAKSNEKIFITGNSRASHLLDIGAEVKDIQNYLGHSKLATTEIYLHRSTRKSIQNLQSIQKLR